MSANVFDTDPMTPGSSGNADLLSGQLTPSKLVPNHTIYNLPNPSVRYHPSTMKVPDKSPTEYVFPRHKLKKSLDDATKIPLVIVACGSFSPITYLHLQMARDYILDNTRYEILGGYFSPVSDAYNKAGLAPASHRVTMCELATADSDWLMVDRWEPAQRVYVRTAKVLDHFHEVLNGGLEGGFIDSDGLRREIKILLLAGGDLIESFAVPNLWTSKDLHHILGFFGCIIIERTGSNVSDFLLQHDILHHHRHNILVIKQYIFNDISSTKVRLFVRRGMSIRFLLPNPCVDYILTHKLYQANSPPQLPPPSAQRSSVAHSSAGSISRNPSTRHARTGSKNSASSPTELRVEALSINEQTEGTLETFVSSTPGDMVTVKLAQVKSPESYC